MSRSASLFRRLSMALVFVFLYAPILVLIVFSFNDSSSRSVWAGFTLDWYRELLRDDLILDAFYTTLQSPSWRRSSLPWRVPSPPLASTT